MHQPARVKYSFASVTETIANFINYKQLDTDRLTEYATKFKEKRNILKSQIGTVWLDNYVKKTEEYRSITDADEKKELLENGFETWTTYMFLRNSNQRHYGTLIQEYQMDYAKRDDRYPRKIADAIEVMKQVKIRRVIGKMITETMKTETRRLEQALLKQVEEVTRIKEGDMTYDAIVVVLMNIYCLIVPVKKYSSGKLVSENGTHALSTSRKTTTGRT